MSNWNKATRDAPLSAPVLVDVSTTEEVAVPRRYFTKSMLGVGGMGEVRLVRDVRIGREVAMKVMIQDATDPRRFLREARVQGQLEHPAIVPVYDLAGGEDGEMFFTMKRVRGVTLEHVIGTLARREAGPYTRRKLLSAFVSVCLAVDFAHTHGVIHRDLKPSNIMLGDFGEVYVLDWGIAKLVNDTEPEQAPTRGLHLPDRYATQGGLVLGTAGYMAPEQLRNDELDPRADVYALGAILFELLVAAPLNVGDDAAALTAATMVDASARVRERCRAESIPPELETICLRATAFDRASRFGSARTLSDAIERVLDGARDLERRKELAVGHATAARLALTAALHDRADEGARRTAMLEAGQALALDPDSRDAARTLVSLMTVLPKEPPSEVARELERARAKAAATAGRLGALGTAGMLCIAPLLVAMGVRSWGLFGLGIACVVLSGAFLLAMARWPGSGRRLFYGLLVSCAAFVTVMSTQFGPLIGAPTIALGLAIVLSFHPFAGRFAPLAVMCAGFLLPFVLGVYSYEVSPSALTVHAMLTSFPPGPTLAYLALSSTLVIVCVGAYVVAVRRTLERAQQDMLVQAWQLRQMLPDTSALGAKGPSQ